ncbi:site-2 protease family protein [Saccharibacillus sp. JS10]|uniref:site-2 protease family protein n=1 Tax=Saccharibacillus sp. JS10 TaxID=2950552 RepID=UPI00210B0322|nr:site-2 protease family protein [Saccharibacillus sp. JS10]MCQ4087434.1 site-2 protease family protein [Saccharibacillus sp. JS10]
MLRKMLPLLIGAAAGGLIAFAALRIIGKNDVGQASAEAANTLAFGGWNPVVMILALALVAMIAILIHELGHIFGAFAVRSRVTRLYWGPFSFLFPERKVRFSWKNRYFFGAMQADIQPYHDEASFAKAIKAQRIVNAAGPAFSLITGLIAYGFAAQLWSMTGMYALLSIGIGLATLFSDGVNAILLGRRNHALVSGWTMLIQNRQLDTDKLRMLSEASGRYLQDLANSDRPAKGRDVYDLFVLYYVKLMDKQISREAAAMQLTQEVQNEWMQAAKPQSIPKLRRDTLIMILVEETVRLCEDGKREEAEELYRKINDDASKSSSLLLKASAYVEKKEPVAKAYMQHIRSMQSDLASYGALVQFEERRILKL